MIHAGSVFSGDGLLDYGLCLAGIEHRWLCEWDPERRNILAQRWPDARVYDDVRHVGHGCELVDLIAGGFPCKGASSAGKQEGFGHPETVLWREQRRAVRELRPRYVLVENVANILSIHRGEVWGEVVGDLAALGYDLVWDCIPAAAVGATHLRDRVFAVATYAGSESDRAHARAASRDAAGDGSQRRDGPARGDCVVADADGQDDERHAGLRSVKDGRTDARGGLEASPDTAAAGLEGRRLRGLPAECGETPSDPASSRRTAAAHPGEPRGMGSNPRAGVDVEWGEYGPAIERWEAVFGPAPKPLVRRVDDGRARRVERSRLSALGDGVQVQVGRIAGEYIVELERRRLADAA